MKKNLVIKVLVVFLLISFSWNAFAQDEAFDNYDRIINVGVGFGTYGGPGKGFSNKVPLISGSFEYGVADMFSSRGGIGVGGYVAYSLFGYNGLDNQDVTVGHFIIGPRGLFHYQFIEKLDTYAGVMLGYDVVSFPKTDLNLSGSAFATSYFIGGRYYLANTIAIFGEIGYGSALGSPLQLGLCYKF